MFCWAYQSDLDQAYAFYCARYENISYQKFLKIGYSEIQRKISSIPKDEPLFEIIKSRVINIGEIKNKEEKKYWYELRKLNKIPNIFLADKELDNILKEEIGKWKEI